jgi:hypothetical protein
MGVARHLLAADVEQPHSEPLVFAVIVADNPLIQTLGVLLSSPIL